MSLDNHRDNIKVNNGSVDAVKERPGMVTPKRGGRQRSGRNIMKFSSIDEERTDIDPLAVSLKFATGENDADLLRPMRQQSVRSMWGDISEKSFESSATSFELSVASNKFKLLEDTNEPMYCPVRQASQTFSSSNEISTIGDSYRSNDIGESYRGIGDLSLRGNHDSYPGFSIGDYYRTNDISLSYLSNTGSIDGSNRTTDSEVPVN